MARQLAALGSSLSMDEKEEGFGPFASEESRTSVAFGSMLQEDEEDGSSPWQTAPSHETESPPPGAWEGDGTPEQVAFRERVLREHINRSYGRRGPAQPDLAASERRLVAGTKVEMATAAAAAASRLLEAANRALVVARETGTPDSGNTIRITGSSGYRGQAHQARVWRRHFKGYYDRTLRARQALSAGPHSEEALRYMLDVFHIPRRVAAPGYSNHQAGIAIDLWQERSSGNRLSNDSSPEARARWRTTWLWGWLNGNAAAFGFRPYEHEEWHWEYKPGAAQREDESSGSAFEADEDFRASDASEEEMLDREGDAEAAYESERAYAGEDASEDESSELELEENERYYPESDEELDGGCPTCGHPRPATEDFRFEMEDSEDQFGPDERISKAFEEEASPPQVEKFFEVWRKGHKVAFRLAGGPEPRPFFYRTGMSTDYDGAPTAYHPNGRAAGALDSLANAGRSGNGKPANWWGVVTTNGRSDGTPYIQQPGRPERDPNPGFYVSPTSLADPHFERTDTRRYVDATKVPYIALPAEAQDRGRTPVRGGAKLGDLAAVVNLKNGRIAYAIFADSGPRGKIGEGSAALGNALGRKGREDLDLLYVVFPGSHKQPPWPVSLATIDREGASLFSRWGGVAMVKRLVAPGMPLAQGLSAPAEPTRVSAAPVPSSGTVPQSRAASFAIPSPRGFNLRGRKRSAGRKMFGIVVHTTGSGPATIAESDAKKRARLGCASAIDCALAIYAAGEGFPHYVIGYDGATYATCPEDYTAWHAGWTRQMGGRDRWRSWSAPAWWSRVWGAGRTPIDLLPAGSLSPNSSHFGIELLGASQSATFTDAQYEALARLVVDIDQRHDLGIEGAPSSKLLGHEDLNPLPTEQHGRANARGGWDPGAHRADGTKPTFSWSKLWSLIERRRRSPELESEDGEGDAETPFLAQSLPSGEEDAPTHSET